MRAHRSRPFVRYANADTVISLGSTIAIGLAIGVGD